MLQLLQRFFIHPAACLQDVGHSLTQTQTGAFGYFWFIDSSEPIVGGKLVALACSTVEVGRGWNEIVKVGWVGMV